MSRLLRRLTSVRVMFWVFLISLSVLSLHQMACKSNGDAKPDPQTDPLRQLEELLGDTSGDMSDDVSHDILIDTSSDTSPAEAMTPDPQRTIARYVYGMRKYESLTRYVTCYPDHPSDIDKRKPYANRKYPFVERRETRIRRSDFTVAVNFEDRWMHNAFIVKDGMAINRFYVHVPDYNKGYRDQSLAGGYPYGPYFSVPRDVMPDKKAYLQPPRMDILFTTAGEYASIRQRQTYWAKKYTHEHQVDVYELVRYRVYADGSIEPCTDYRMVDCGNDSQGKTIWAKVYY